MQLPAAQRLYSQKIQSTALVAHEGAEIANAVTKKVTQTLSWFLLGVCMSLLGTAFAVAVSSRATPAVDCTVCLYSLCAAMHLRYWTLQDPNKDHVQ